MPNNKIDTQYLKVFKKAKGKMEYPFIDAKDIELNLEDLVLCTSSKYNEMGSIYYEDLTDSFLWKLKDKYSYLTKNQAYTLGIDFLEKGGSIDKDCDLRLEDRLYTKKVISNFIKWQGTSTFLCAITLMTLIVLDYPQFIIWLIAVFILSLLSNIELSLTLSLDS